jgi:hypothetical protein
MAARVLGVTRQTLNDLINGQAGVLAEVRRRGAGTGVKRFRKAW